MAGLDVSLEGGHDVMNLFDINLELNSKNGINDSYIYNKFGSPEGNLGNYYDSKNSRTTYVGIGLGFISEEAEWETSKNRNDRILKGWLPGVRNKISESTSFPVYGTIKTNFNGNTPLTTTTRSWSIGASIKALLGLHANAELGYELEYQVD